MSETENLSFVDKEIRDSFNLTEETENKAREVEMILKKISGLAPYLPKRNYGQPFKGSDFGITARSLIEREDRELASFLGLSTGLWRKVEEAETARQQAIEETIRKTEELRMKNAQDADFRRSRIQRGFNPATGEKIF